MTRWRTMTRKDDNNKDDNNDKGISALGLDRDMGFSRGHQGHQPHNDDNEKEDDNEEDEDEVEYNDKDDSNNKDHNNCKFQCPNCSTSKNPVFFGEQRVPPL